MKIENRILLGLLGIIVLTFLSVIFLKYRILENESIIDVLLISNLVLSSSLFFDFYKENRKK